MGQRLFSLETGGGGVLQDLIYSSRSSRMVPFPFWSSSREVRIKIPTFFLQSILGEPSPKKG